MSLLAENQDCPAFIKKLLKQRINTLEPAWKGPTYPTNWCFFVFVFFSKLNLIRHPYQQQKLFTTSFQILVFSGTPFLRRCVMSSIKSTSRKPPESRNIKPRVPKKNPPNLTVAAGWWINSPDASFWGIYFERCKRKGEWSRNAATNHIWYTKKNIICFGVWPPKKNLQTKTINSYRSSATTIFQAFAPGSRTWGKPAYWSMDWRPSIEAFRENSHVEDTHSWWLFNPAPRMVLVLVLLVNTITRF